MLNNMDEKNKILNNQKLIRGRNRNHSHYHTNVRTNTNKLTCSANFFKASPAPPRTKALLAAMRLKEQQEYR